MPCVGRRWNPTPTKDDPIIQRGVQWSELNVISDQLKQLASSLRSPADIDRVLATDETANMVVRGDVAGLQRATGVATSTRACENLTSRTIAKATTRAKLTEHGVAELRARLQVTDGGKAPTTDIIAPRTSIMRIAPTPLPLAATAGRLPAASVERTIAVADSPPPVGPKSRAAARPRPPSPGRTAPMEEEPCIRRGYGGSALATRERARERQKRKSEKAKAERAAKKLALPFSI